jgi:hypothetical protein
MSLNKIWMSAVILGAAALATPAMAQAANPSTSNTPATQAAEMPSSASSATANSQASDTSQSANTNASAANTQVAAGSNTMDTKAAANANVDAVGNTSKKYVRSHRAKDFAKEQSITQQLNQQASAAAAPSTTIR